MKNPFRRFSSKKGLGQSFGPKTVDVGNTTTSKFTAPIVRSVYAVPEENGTVSLVLSEEDGTHVATVVFLPEGAAVVSSMLAASSVQALRKLYGGMLN
jgi:hypothetical protein